MKGTNKVTERDFFDRFIETSLKKKNIRVGCKKRATFGAKCLYCLAGMIYLTVAALVLL